MSLTFYLITAPVVFVFSGLLAMAGLGAAFLFVPFFYYLGVPLAEAAATALLLNAISLSFATVNYWRGRLIDWRIALPVAVIAVVFAPLGARLTPHVDKATLLLLFAMFLVFAGVMMLFYQGRAGAQNAGPAKVWLVGAGVGGTAGFIGGLLGVGGATSSFRRSTGWDSMRNKRQPPVPWPCVFLPLRFSRSRQLGKMDMTFLGIMALMAAGGSLAGSQLMKEKLSSSQLKKIIGVVLWLVAAKMFFDVFK